MVYYVQVAKYTHYVREISRKVFSKTKVISLMRSHLILFGEMLVNVFRSLVNKQIQTGYMSKPGQNTQTLFSVGGRNETLHSYIRAKSFPIS